MTEGFIFPSRNKWRYRAMVSTCRISEPLGVWWVFQLLIIFLSTDLVLSDHKHLQTWKHREEGRQLFIPHPFLALICSQQFSIWLFNLVFFLCCCKLLFQTISEGKTHKSMTKNHWLVILTVRDLFCEKRVKSRRKQAKKGKSGKINSLAFLSLKRFQLRSLTENSLLVLPSFPH